MDKAVWTCLGPALLRKVQVLAGLKGRGVVQVCDLTCKSISDVVSAEAPHCSLPELGGAAAACLVCKHCPMEREAQAVKHSE